MNVSVNSVQMTFKWLKLQLQIDTMCVTINRAKQFLNFDRLEYI